MITFFFSECGEFHSMGEYHEGLTLQEAVDYYKKCPQGNHVKTIGFRLHDRSIYDDMDYNIYSGGTLLRDDVNMIEHFRENPEVQKALNELQDMVNRGVL